MGETVIGRLIRQRGIPWGTLLRWLPRAPRVARLLGRVFRDPRVPVGPKLLAVAAVAYFFVPVDLVPEAVFGPLGVADDIGLLVLGTRTLLSAAPPAVLAEHIEAVGLTL